VYGFFGKTGAGKTGANNPGLNLDLNDCFDLLD
jgi:hypothetical protein